MGGSLALAAEPWEHTFVTPSASGPASRARMLLWDFRRLDSSASESGRSSFKATW